MNDCRDHGRVETVFDEDFGIARGRVYELRNGKFSMSVTCLLESDGIADLARCQVDWGGLFDTEREATRTVVRRMKAESGHTCGRSQ